MMANLINVSVESTGNLNVDKRLTSDNLNPCIKEMQYTIRDPLFRRATIIEKELDLGIMKPFREVIKANSGDAQSMGQTPITFIRQVLALVCFPELMNDSEFPDDVKERAKLLLSGCTGGSIGSYTEAAGIEIIRRHVAQYIAKRDGFPSDWEDVILCAGASRGIESVLKLLICETDGLKSGIMIPIPQYPLYSATITELDMHKIGYHLNEYEGWSLTTSELTRAMKEAKGKCKPRALVVINPGNPTGQVLQKQNMQEIIRFAYDEGLILLADEVYQHNIYEDNNKFYSFKKVSKEMGSPYSEIELASFMSCSKGYMGECGLRGGYAEFINLDPYVKVMYLKSISAMLCPSVIGQVAMDCVVKPPEPGQPSYELFMKEKNSVLTSLAERAKLIVDKISNFKGMSCNKVQGAMYAFPQIHLPPKIVDVAENQKLHPDEYYALHLLEETGICIIPGSVFGQEDGTYHFRITIVPQLDKLQTMMEKFRTFHDEFMEKYKCECA